MSFIRLRALAEDYSRCLSEGSEIIDDTDAEYVKPFHHLLGGLLAQRGLVLAKTARGEIVKVAPWLLASPPVQPAPPQKRAASCTICGLAWFDCPHGVGDGIVVRW